MDVQALFGISILMSFVTFGLVTKLYIWPHLQGRERNEALLALVVPHAFRFVGLSFIVPGGRLCFAVVGVCQARSIRRPGRGAARNRGFRGSLQTLVIFDPACLAVQCMGHCRPAICLLPGAVWEARPQATWSRIFHSHRGGAAVTCFARPDIPASVSTKAVNAMGWSTSIRPPGRRSP